jgi:hypothetical protein
MRLSIEGGGGCRKAAVTSKPSVSSRAWSLVPINPDAPVTNIRLIEYISNLPS